MGIEAKRFTDATYLNPEYYCSICADIFLDPVQCKEEHIYCRKCISDWIKQQPTCPIDRQKLQEVDLKPVPRVFRTMLNTLDVKCEFEDLGCKAVVKVALVDAHLKECDFNPTVKVVCDQGCDGVIAKFLLSGHSCMEFLKEQVQRLQLEQKAISAELNKKVCAEIGYVQEIKHLKAQLKDNNEKNVRLRVSSKHIDRINQLYSEQTITSPNVFKAMSSIDLAPFYPEWKANNYEHVQQLADCLENCYRILTEGAQVLIVDSDCYIAACVCLLVGENGRVHYLGTDADMAKLEASGHSSLVEYGRLVQRSQPFSSEPVASAASEDTYDVIFIKEKNMIAQLVIGHLKEEGIAFDFHKGIGLIGKPQR